MALLSVLFDRPEKTKLQTVDEQGRERELLIIDATSIIVHTHELSVTEQPIEGQERPVLTGSPDQIVEDLRRYGKAGLHHIVGIPAVDGEADPLKATIQAMQFMAQEVLPLFR